MKTSIPLIITTIFFMINLNAQNLGDYQWKNRILVIQSPNETNAKYQEQMMEFANSAQALAERKMLIFEAVGDKLKTTNYLLAENDGEWKNAKEVQKSSQKIEAFRLILIGLDAGVKLAQNEILTKEELFRIIDSMPMRIQEKRSSKE